MTAIKSSTVAWALAGILVATAALAEEHEAGQVAAVWGTVHVDRAGAANAAGPVSPGTAIFEGDRLTTGAGDRAKIILAEHSVVDIAPGSEVVLRKQEADPATGRIDSLIEVVRGKIRARLEVDSVGHATLYQVETPTAVVTRGTDFIVLHDTKTDATRVIGVRDTAEVIGRLALAGGAVRIGPQEATTVRKGRYPVAPEALPLDEFSQLLQGLTIVGTGSDDGLVRGHMAATGQLLSPRDLPGELEGTEAATQPARELQVGAPRPFLADEMSDDVRVHDQPLLEYERQQPGLPLPEDKGGVIVEF